MTKVKQKLLGLVHTVRFFSDCDCVSYFCNKWAVQVSMELFTLCNCMSIKQKQITVAIRKKTHNVNVPLGLVRYLNSKVFHVFKSRRFKPYFSIQYKLPKCQNI